ncbi:MAG TPA: (2Fe-2S)-binding protein [Woeseiaceae bacterium]|nr:(2Fe-2S)-binding protein [Woeseiaceae bacterium]
MYVCICKAVTDKQIRRAKAAGIDTLDDLRDTLGVTGGCGSCMDMVESILSEDESISAPPPRPSLYIPSAA